MQISIEYDQEEDGRWLAEIPEWPGVMAYGANREEAARRVKALALRVIADKIDNGECVAALESIAFARSVGNSTVFPFPA